jgi:dienelactone hydrolase
MRTLLVMLLSLFAAVTVQAAEPTQVKIQSLHRDQAMLTGYLLRPESDAPAPTVLLLHGCSGPLTAKGQIASRERAWMNLFVSKGYVALLLDSFNPRGFSSICTNGQRPLTAEKDRPYDAYAALGWLRAQPFVNGGKVAVMGWSHGAMTTLATISEQMIKEVGWTQPGFLTAVAFYPGCIELNKTKYVNKTPLLMQLGEKDDWTPAKNCVAMAKATGGRGGAPIELDVYPGAYHAFDSPTGKVHVRSANSGGGDRQVHVGADPAARAKAIARTAEWLAKAFQ